MVARIRTALRRDSGASVVEFGLLLVAVAGIVVVMALLLYRGVVHESPTGPCPSSTSQNC